MSAPVRVLHVASEVHPLVKTGGLADVVGALPRALSRLGACARLLVPGYPAVMAAAEHLSTVERAANAFGAAPARLLLGRLRGVDVPVYVLDQPERFARPGNPYLGPDGRDWPDNHLRFSALGWAAERLARGADPEFGPDVVHGHDWQAGAALARIALGAGPRCRLVFTIHNLAYQGLVAAEQLASLDLPEEAFGLEGMEFYGQGSLLKAGIAYADAITTVSRTYAVEIQTEAHGHGLDGLLRHRAAVLVGIVNGVDYDVWNPRTDAALPVRYDADTVHRRAVVALGLRSRFALAASDGPLFAVVSRLAHHKGLDLLADATASLVAAGAQLAVLGTGEPPLEERLTALAREHRGRVGVHVGFDEGLAHRLYAGADVVVVPSRSEPCGLTQLYALRYGAVPLVRRTGGLADTVVDATDAAPADGTATGFVFDEPTAPALAAAIGRAVAAFGDPPRWRALQRAGMAADFGWERAAREHLAVYRAE